MKTCTKCLLEKPPEEFFLEKKRGNLYIRAQCKQCELTRHSNRRASKYATWVARLAELKNVPCEICEGVFPTCVMDFDHRIPAEKLGDISSSAYCRTKEWQDTEISKCAVICVRCHRLKTSSSKPTGRKRQILRNLKNVPCTDCGGSFHYSQMDFDHVRGHKVNAVANMTGKALNILLDEVNKCDIVCANCHRIRTYVRKNGGIISVTSNVTTCSLGAWQDSVGTMEDQAVAAMFGVTRVEVWELRKNNKIPAFKKIPSNMRWQNLVGTMSDSALAKIGGVVKSTVGYYRRRVGVAAYISNRSEPRKAA